MEEFIVMRLGSITNSGFDDEVDYILRVMKDVVESGCHPQ